MLRLRAMHRFKREYFHSLRNGLTSEDAADTALTRVKSNILEYLDSDQGSTYVKEVMKENDYPDTPTHFEHCKMEVWGDVLEIMLAFQMMLINIPVDRTRLTSDRNKDITHNPDKPVVTTQCKE